MNIIYNSNIDVSVTVNGRPTRIYPHEGKFFIESREGTEYAIKIKNRHSFRIEVVVSVDGLSVVSGKTASSQDSGYVIAAYDEMTIKGFRSSNDVVGAFKFVSKGSSYAASKSAQAKDNVGIIAIAAYAEKYVAPVYWFNSVGTNSATITTPNWPYNDPWHTSPPFPDKWNDFTYTTSRSASNDVFGVASNATTDWYEKPRGVEPLNARVNSTNDTVKTANFMHATSATVKSAAPEEFVHGTGWGKKIEDKVTTITFERQTTAPTYMYELFYNSKEQLEAIGIKIVPEKLVNAPRGFPADFATPPVGWNG